jgi:plastocyanin
MKGPFAALVALIVLGGGYYWYSSQQVPALNTGDTNMGMPMGENTNTNTVTPTATTPTATPTNNTSTSTNTATNPGTPSETGATAPVKEFKVSSTGMAFNTKTLTVNRGDRVRITYTNGGGTHDFRVDGYNVGTKVIQGGASETFEFVADKAGSFEYYCSVGSHRQMGMKGTLTVQ